MNESVETNDEQDQEDQTSVTDENSNAQNGDASVTDENSNAQSSSQDSNGSSNQEGSDASTSTDTGSQSDDSDESSDDVSPERLKELEEIATRGEDLRKRLANRLAHQGRERIATEKELEEERSKSTQLEAENKRLREQSQNRTTDTSQQNTGSDANDDESDADTGTGSDEMTRLERENQELREQLTNTEAEEGGFYETLSTNPEVRAQQVEHNMKVMRDALIATGDAEQNRQEREVHGTAVKAYTDLGIDVDTAEQIVALDIDAMEAENLWLRNLNLNEIPRNFMPMQCLRLPFVTNGKTMHVNNNYKTALRPRHQMVVKVRQ